MTMAIKLSATAADNRRNRFNCFVRIAIIIVEILVNFTKFTCPRVWLIKGVPVLAILERGSQSSLLLLKL